MINLLSHVKKWQGKSSSFKAHKVLMMIIMTTSTTSPTPRPTLSLRSDALLLNLEASDRKRSLDAFSRSDLIIMLCQILQLACVEGVPVLKVRKIVAPVKHSPNVTSHHPGHLERLLITLMTLKPHLAELLCSPLPPGCAVQPTDHPVVVLS